MLLCRGLEQMKPWNIGLPGCRDAGSPQHLPRQGSLVPTPPTPALPPWSWGAKAEGVRQLLEHLPRGLAACSRPGARLDKYYQCVTGLSRNALLTAAQLKTLRVPGHGAWVRLELLAERGKPSSCCNSLKW